MSNDSIKCGGGKAQSLRLHFNVHCWLPLSNLMPTVSERVKQEAGSPR